MKPFTNARAEELRAQWDRLSEEERARMIAAVIEASRKRRGQEAGPARYYDSERPFRVRF